MSIRLREVGVRELRRPRRWVGFPPAARGSGAVVRHARGQVVAAVELGGSARIAAAGGNQKQSSASNLDMAPLRPFYQNVSPTFHQAFRGLLYEFWRPCRAGTSRALLISSETSRPATSVDGDGELVPSSTRANGDEHIFASELQTNRVRYHSGDVRWSGTAPDGQVADR